MPILTRDDQVVALEYLEKKIYLYLLFIAKWLNNNLVETYSWKCSKKINGLKRVPNRQSVVQCRDAALWEPGNASGGPVHVHAGAFAQVAYECMWNQPLSLLATTSP